MSAIALLEHIQARHFVYLYNFVYLAFNVLDKILRQFYCSQFILVGELLGMEYLYSQTGKSLTPVLQNPEEEDRLVEEVNDEDLQDEGFGEEITEDITVPVLYEDEPCRDLVISPSSLPLPQSPTSLVEPSTSSGGEGQHLAPAPLVLLQPPDTGSSLSNEAQVRHFKGFIYFQSCFISHILTFIFIY